MRPPKIAIAMNVAPFSVIAVSNRYTPRTVTGILHRDPVMAYVEADVSDTHHSDAKFKKKPKTPARIFIVMKVEFIISGFLSMGSSLNKRINGNIRMEHNKLL